VVKHNSSNLRLLGKYFDISFWKIEWFPAIDVNSLDSTVEEEVGKKAAWVSALRLNLSGHVVGYT
jgi:hypothetical protein